MASLGHNDFIVSDNGSGAVNPFILIDSDNGLVPSGNKPLSEPMLTQLYVAIWRH